MNLKVGEIFVRFGRVLRISKISGGLIELLPYFTGSNQNSLVYSIPRENFSGGNLRPLIGRVEMQQLLKKLQRSAPSAPVDVLESKSSLNLDRLATCLPLVKTLWQEKQDHAGYLPGGRLSLFQSALSQASEEIAAVDNISPEQAKTNLLAALRKNHSRPAADE